MESRVLPESLVIRGGRVIDPSANLDKVSDLFLIGDKIAEIGNLEHIPAGTKVFEASGMVVCPGFIDIHCHLREPGQEYKETIASGTKAAAAGGFTTVCAMPNTDPPIDNRSILEFVTSKARSEGSVRVLPIGCVTKRSEGRELAEMAELADAGAIGFSDDGHPVWDANIMRQALSYGAGLGLPIINHCEVPELAQGASMNEGWIATRLGIRGMPNSAEEIMVARDISLAELTGGHVHLAHVSTSGTLSLVKEAKRRGVKVTCEVTPHHLTLTDQLVMGSFEEENAFDPLSSFAYDTSAKVNPPLRSKEDVSVMAEGLSDGTIDFIATDHAPHSAIDKMCTFQEAAFGISVLETALGSVLTLVHNGLITLPKLISKLTTEPASFLNSNLGTLQVGKPADITIFDPNWEWYVDSSKFLSKGKNTPLNGQYLKGKVKATFLGGQKVYEDS